METAIGYLLREITRGGSQGAAGARCAAGIHRLPDSSESDAQNLAKSLAHMWELRGGSGRDDSRSSGATLLLPGSGRFRAWLRRRCFARGCGAGAGAAAARRQPTTRARRNRQRRKSHLRTSRSSTKYLKKAFADCGSTESKDLASSACAVLPAGNWNGRTSPSGCKPRPAVVE